MIKLASIFLTLLPLVGYADTLDTWSVYINDSLIGEYNSVSEKNEVFLNGKTIQKSDSISVIYWNDHPCSKCEYYYIVKEKHTGFKVYTEKRTEVTKKVHFPLFKMKEFPGPKEFVFSIYENSHIKNKDSYLVLLNLKIE